MHSDPTISIRTRILTDGSKVFDILLEQDEHQIVLGIYTGTTNPTAAAHRAAIPLAESAVFLRKVINGLMARYGLTDVGPLVFDRFRLRDSIEERIDEHRKSERAIAYTQYLALDSGLTVSDEYAVNFKDIAYEPSEVYQGSFQFRKHYFGPKPGDLKETTPLGALTEEFKCAQFLDSKLPGVRFWVRNLSRRSTSFRLQTSTDWFYPDFVCQLEDGRILVVEYKGGHFLNAPDAQEKRDIGNLWAARSNGHCLFAMPSDNHFDEILLITKSLSQSF